MSLSNDVNAGLSYKISVTDYVATSADVSKIHSQLSNNCCIVSALSDAPTTNVNVGDVTIVSGYITTDVAMSAELSTRTAYYWNGSSWAAMDGNYSISNVYFNTDMVFTEKFGHYDVPVDGFYTLSSKGKSLYSVLNDAFKQAKSGTKFNPTFRLDVSGDSREVGETYNIPSAKLTMESNGSYPQYGPEDTGVSVLPGKAIVLLDNYPTLSCSNTNIMRAGSFISSHVSSNIEYTDSTSTYKYNASVEWSDGISPLNNLGELDPDNKISTGLSTLTKSVSFSGYRYGFYGYRLATED